MLDVVDDLKRLAICGKKNRAKPRDRSMLDCVRLCQVPVVEAENAPCATVPLADMFGGVGSAGGGAAGGGAGGLVAAAVTGPAPALPPPPPLLGPGGCCKCCTKDVNLAWLSTDGAVPGTGAWTGAASTGTVSGTAASWDGCIRKMIVKGRFAAAVLIISITFLYGIPFVDLEFTPATKECRGTSASLAIDAG